MADGSGAEGGADASSRWRLPDQLPPLSGWGRSLFLIVWGALFAFAAGLFVLGLPSTLDAPLPPGPAVQAGLGLDDNDPSLILRPIGAEAERSGIKRGDRLIAIDGVAVGADRAEIDRLLVERTGERLVVDLRAPDGSVSRRVLTRDPENRRGFAQAGLSRQSFYAVADTFRWLSSLLALICAAVLVARRLRDPLAPWASLTMIVLALGTGGIGATLSNLGGGWTSIFWWANHAPFLPMVVALVPNGSLRPRWTWAVLAAAPLLTALALVWPEAVGSSALGLLLAAGVLLVFHRYRSMAASERQQIRWVLFGLTLAILAFAIGAACGWLAAQAESYATVLWLNLVQGPAFMVSIILLVGAITAALLRYRLYDADVAISRSVALGALTLLLLGIFAGTEKLIEALGEQYLGDSLGAMAGGIGAALAAVMIVPLHHRVNEWAEKRFQRQLVELRHNLPLLLGDLRQTAGMERVAAVVLDAVRNGVRARHAALLVGETLADARGIEADAVAGWQRGWTPSDRQGLDSNRADPLFPLRVPLEADGHGRVGWLLLGPRPDGSFYGKDERDALAAIADPVARAIEIVRSRGAREAQADGVLAAIMARLDRMEQAIASA